MFEFITGPIFLFFDLTLGVFFHLFGDNQVANVLVGVFTVSSLISVFIVLVTSKVVDQREMKALKAKISQGQEKLKAAQKKGDLKQAKKLEKEALRRSSEMGRKSMQPMFYTMIPIILVFTWLRNYDYLVAIAEQGYIVLLPFALPVFGDKLGWLGWYILTSFATSPLVRKLLMIEGP